MVDATGSNLSSAGPSYAVEVLGLNMVPVAGDEFQVCESEAEVRKSICRGPHHILPSRQMRVVPT